MAKKESSYISIVGLGRMYGLSKNTIQKYMNQNKIPFSVDANGYRRLLKCEVVPIMDEIQAAKKASVFNQGIETSSNYNMAKAEKEKYNAKIARLHYETKLKELIKIEVVERRLFELALQVRDSVLNLPDKVSAELASINDERRINTFLDAAIRDCLLMISEGELEKWRNKKLRV